MALRAEARHDEIGAHLTAYKNRQPMDPATALRRYTSLNALECMLRDKKLRLTRVDRFEDQFEGSVPKQQIDDQLPAFSSVNAMLMMGESVAALGPTGGAAVPPRPINDPWTRMTIRRRVATRSAHASCWNWGDESEAMWRLYCKDDGVLGQGVALRSTFGKLEASLGHHNLIIGRVVYRLYHEGPAFTDDLDPFMHKRLGFECEREVRVLGFDQPHYSTLALALTGHYGFAPVPAPPAELPEYIYLAWRPLDTADAIVISPYASEAYEQRVRAAIAAIDPAAIGIVELSLLSERRYGANF
jgi:hypothetical protein